MKKYSKNAVQFNCISCDFNCSKQSDYIRHINTTKHINRTNRTLIEQTKEKM